MLGIDIHGRRLCGPVATVGFLLVTAALAVATPVRGVVPVGETVGILPADPGSSQDPVLVSLREAGRLTRTADGTVVLLESRPPGLDASSSAHQLDTTYTALVVEPRGSGGYDDHDQAYTDKNYWNFCAPGAATVAAYYWPNGQDLFMGIAGANYTEPRDNGWQETTFWWSYNDDPSSHNYNVYGRGLIMWFAEYVDPTGHTWPYDGMIKWEDNYPVGTPINRLRDGLNWEISGRTNKNYWYIQSDVAHLTRATLNSDIVYDIDLDNPVIANVRTSNGTVYLPSWNVSTYVNHSIAVVGYDNVASTYTYLETCGSACNGTGHPKGLYTVSQSTLWALIQAETGHVGILW